MTFYLKTIKKIKKFILNNWLFLSLLLVLFNSSYHLDTYSFYVRGLFIDYYIPQIFLNHLVFLVFFFLLLLSLKKIRRNYFLFIFYFLVFFLFNFLISFKKEPFLITLFNKFLPFLFFSFIAFNYKLSIKKNFHKFLIPLNIFLILVFLLQYISKSSFFPYFPFGFFKYKGVTYNIDYLSFLGSKYPIPLGMFPHPNVFAAYLSFLNIFFLRKKNPFFFLNLITISFLASLSALLFNFLLFIFIYKENKKAKLASIFFLILFFLSYFFGFKEVSLIERTIQYKSFVFLFLKRPLFGWGFGNYLISLPVYENYLGRVIKIQPLHNIFLLYLLEFGLLGLLPFIILKRKILYYFKVTPFLLFIFFFGLSDHFLYTLNQGFILLLIAFICHKLTIRTYANK